MSAGGCRRRGCKSSLAGTIYIMRSVVVAAVSLLLSNGAFGVESGGVGAVAPPSQAQPEHPQDVVPVVPQSRDVDINRPRTPFDCELPIGENWYGSRARCLAYLCGGENVYNEYLFDADGRRRKNPCYGQSPTEFPPE